MNIRHETKIKFDFPLGLYFQQLFDANAYVKFFNPYNFWRSYRIQHLETCWEFNTVKYLEDCYQIEWKPEKSATIKPVEISTKTDSYKILPWEKTPRNTILMVQPPMELKYRGITYTTSRIVAVDVNHIKGDRHRTESSSLSKFPDRFNHNDNSEASNNIL